MVVARSRRILSVIVVFVLTITLFSGAQFASGATVRAGVSTYTSQTTTVGTVTASVLNVRTTYSSQAKIIGTLLKGANAYIISSTNGWYKITFNKTTGWVYGGYLTNIRPVSSAGTSTGSTSASSSSVSSSSSAVSSSSGISSSSSSSSASSAGSTSSNTSTIGSTSSNTSTIGSTSSNTSSASSSTSSSSASSSPSSTPAPSTPVSSLPSRIMAGYYTGWSAYGGFTPDKIRASMLNVVHYAFAGVGTDLKIAVGDPYIDYTNFTKLNALKKSYPNLKTVISVGGWDGSSRFSDMALTDATRKAFAQSCVSFIKQYGFDGVDIDWEYPVSGGSPGRPEDKTNFTLLMQTLRQALNAQAAADGKYYYLTFAGGASNSYLNNIQPVQISSYIDYAVDMTYDLHGPWDSYTDFNAPLYTPAEASPQYKISVDSSIRAWLNSGVPSGKLVMGVPFYGYIYSGVGSANNGLYQRYTSAKSIGYDSIVSGYLSNSLFTKFFHTGAQVPYLFGNGQFISYDDAASVMKKAQYSSANGLRGMSAWELSYDKGATLLSSAYNNIH